MNKKIRVVSLFAGIGGFEKGFENSNMNFEMVFESEIDDFAKKTYSFNFDTKNMNGDIKLIKESDIPDHDLLCGGFPCQSFSVAGKQKGFSDQTRGTLFFDIIRIIKYKKPKYILLENVKNLVNHDNGNTIKTIIKNISDCNYTFDFSIINSNEAGVPQNRERTYIFGIYDYKSEKFEKDIRSSKVDSIKEWANTNNLKTMNFFNKVKFNNKQKYIKDILEKNVEQNFYFNSYKIKKYLATVNQNELNNKCQNRIIKVIDLPREIHNDLDRQRRVYSINGISPTLLARSDSPKILIKENGNLYIRKITPIEAFKIQGFDTGFVNNIKKNDMSITQLYKQSGNAVSPPVITQIINSFLEFIND